MLPRAAYGFRFQLPMATVDVILGSDCGGAQFIMDRVSDHVVRQCFWPDPSPEFVQMLKRLFPRYPLRDKGA